MGVMRKHFRSSAPQFEENRSFSTATNAGYALVARHDTYRFNPCTFQHSDAMIGAAWSSGGQRLMVSGGTSPLARPFSVIPVVAIGPPPPGQTESTLFPCRRTGKRKGGRRCPRAGCSLLGTKWNLRQAVLLESAICTPNVSRV